MDVYSRPHYEHLYEQLEAVFRRCKADWNEPYDWENRDLAAKNQAAMMAETGSTYRNATSFFAYDPIGFNAGPSALNGVSPSAEKTGAVSAECVRTANDPMSRPSVARSTTKTLTLEQAPSGAEQVMEHHTTIASQLQSLEIADTTQESGGTLSRLETLPKELLLKIVNYAPEAVLELRLMVNCFAPDFTIFVPKSRTNQFKIRLKTHQFPENLKEEFMQSGRHSYSASLTVYRMRFKNLVGNERVLKSLGAAMGCRIEKALLSECGDSVAVAAACKLLEGVHIEKLSVFARTLTSDADTLLLKSDLMNNVNQLTLSVDQVTIADPVNTLLHLSSILPSLHIEQNFVNGVDLKRNYYFGVYDVDWAKIIMKMFSGRMDKLYIENYFFTGYLPSSSLDILRERLPSLGKQVWFSASCSENYSHQQTIVDDHSVRAGPDSQGVRRPGTTPRPYNISVKHVSREAEPFETYYPYQQAFRAMP